MGCPVLSPGLPQYILPPLSLSLPSRIPPSLFLSILKGTLANLIIDLPDAAVLRRGWNNLLSLRMVWPRASSALADKWKRIKKLLMWKEGKAYLYTAQFCFNLCKLCSDPYHKKEWVREEAVFQLCLWKHVTCMHMVFSILMWMSLV